MTLKITAILLVLCGLASCSTMSDEFSCNLTAGDSCLTIDAVDAMTDGKDKSSVKRKRLHYQNKRVSSEASNKGQLWLSAWKDSQGVEHEEETMLINPVNKSRG